MHDFMLVVVNTADPHTMPDAVLGTMMDYLSKKEPVKPSATTIWTHKEEDFTLILGKTNCHVDHYAKENIKKEQPLTGRVLH